ncbi:hypothetical protein H2199_008773 [Coniosporium tulheliwenetii]|uniref:Uncharacterized protein n=1 Tax=Coniosporium tulheliwenetii TaxID=3383036 RepID=A0ACC2YIF3_9PEZI|nr:hypothetical protein H2199_008773 [Cladosporium sp. JES 115]
MRKSQPTTAPVPSSAPAPPAPVSIPPPASKNPAARRRVPTAAPRKVRRTQPPPTRARHIRRDPSNEAEAEAGPSAGSAAAPLVVDDAVISNTRQEEDKPFQFEATWRVMCGKEDLKADSAVYEVKPLLDEPSFFFADLVQFEQQAFNAIRPREFNRRRITAILSIEKMLAKDSLIKELANQDDIDSLDGLLTRWHKRHPQRDTRVIITILVEEILAEASEDPYSEAPQQSQGDPDEVVEQFIHWVKARRNWSKEPQQQFLSSLKDTLAEDAWDLNGLQRDITEERWERYSFPIGYLGRIRKEVSSFKKWQRATRSP